jgi:hypothetical protein
MPELIHSADKSTRLQHIFELNSYALVGGIYLVGFLLVRMVSQLAGEEDMASRVRDIFSMSVQPEQTASIVLMTLWRDLNWLKAVFRIRICKILGPPRSGIICTDPDPALDPDPSKN